MKAIQRVGVIGAGTMGNGIAQTCAVAGIEAVMLDVQDVAVQRGMKTIQGSLERLLKKEKLSAADRDAALARIKGTTSYDELKSCDLIIEAATENLELKLKILRQVDAGRFQREVAHGRRRRLWAEPAKREHHAGQCSDGDQAPCRTDHAPLPALTVTVSTPARM